MLPAGEAGGASSSCEVIENPSVAKDVQQAPYHGGVAALVSRLQGAFHVLRATGRECRKGPGVMPMKRWSGLPADGRRLWRTGGSFCGAAAPVSELQQRWGANGHSVWPATVPPSLNCCAGGVSSANSRPLRCRRVGAGAPSASCGRPGIATLPGRSRRLTNRGSGGRGPPVRFRGCEYGFPPAPQG